MNAFSSSDLILALPEIYLAGAICVVLLFDLFFTRGSAARTATFTLAVLLVGAVLTWYTGPRNVRVTAFSGMYVADGLATLLKLAAFLFTAVAVFYGGPFLGRRALAKGEYYVLTLTMLLGVLVLASAASMLTIYIGVELLSLSLYALVAFDRDSGLAAEAAMKYFVLGAIASGVLLYGMSILYGITGTLDLALLSAQLPTHAQGSGAGLILGLSFIVVAVAFKFGAVPFHMWVPDVYQGAPTSSAVLVATVSKLASFAMVFRLVAEGLSGQSADWSQMFAALAVISAVAGNVIAIAQTNLLRMLAYSAIANVGFILFGFAAGSIQGYEAALYYTLAYLVMTVAAFGVVMLSSRDGFEADQLDHYKGLASRDPLMAGVFAVVMFSTAGVPPFIGFWAKLRIIEALLASNLLWLAIIAVVASVIGAFFYLRVVWLMYFEAPGELPGASRGAALRAVLAINGIAVLLLGVLPGGLLELCRQVIPGG
ncbi:MAG: NADH-quinone oxidoreductase subunit NuoN [Steroidobacteraceae bacterium]